MSVKNISVGPDFHNLFWSILSPEFLLLPLTDLPRVYLQEDSEGNFHTRNLTVHQANTEEDGMCEMNLCSLTSKQLVCHRAFLNFTGRRVFVNDCRAVDSVASQPGMSTAIHKAAL